MRIESQYQAALYLLKRTTPSQPNQMRACTAVVYQYWLSLLQTVEQQLNGMAHFAPFIRQLQQNTAAAKSTLEDQVRSGKCALGIDQLMCEMMQAQRQMAANIPF